MAGEGCSDHTPSQLLPGTEKKSPPHPHRTLPHIPVWATTLDYARSQAPPPANTQGCQVSQYSSESHCKRFQPPGICFSVSNLRYSAALQPPLNITHENSHQTYVAPVVVCDFHKYRAIIMGHHHYHATHSNYLTALNTDHHPSPSHHHPAHHWDTCSPLADNPPITTTRTLSPSHFAPPHPTLRYPPPSQPPTPPSTSPSHFAPPLCPD